MIVGDIHHTVALKCPTRREPQFRQKDDYFATAGCHALRGREDRPQKENAFRRIR
jgi:hypothetical protein